jgi:signal transduction histidine kinase
LATNSSLSAELGRASQPLFASELAATPLSAEEKRWIQAAKISVWIPLIRHHNLQGLLLLGPRRAADPFDEEERRLLSTLAWEAAIASENVQLVRALRQRTAEVNSLYSQLLESREAERKRLARELHDQIIQELINLRGLADPTTSHLGSTIEEKARNWQRHLQLVIEDLRDICTDLRPAALDDLSLALAVQGYIEDATRQFDLHIHLSISGDGNPLTQRLPEDIEICLFRVLQEAVANAYRHARVSDIWIDLIVKHDRVSLEVRDQGGGFQCPPNLGVFIRHNHFGLAGLQERMALVGGTLSITSAPGKGTILQAVAPLNGTDRLVGPVPINTPVYFATNLAGYPMRRGSD